MKKVDRNNSKLSKKFKRVTKNILSVLLAFIWLLTGWPGLNSFNFPPEIKEVEAATETIRPTDAYAPDAWTTPASGYDGNTGTSTYFTSLNKIPSISFGGATAGEETNSWATKSQTWTAATLYYWYEQTDGGAGTNDTTEVVLCNYSGGTCTTVTTLISGTVAVAKQERSQLLDSADWGGAGFPNIAQARIRVSGVKNAGPDGDTSYMYDVRVDGTYTSSPTFTQNAYRWYVDSDTANPSDPWSLVTGINLAENTAITITPVDNDPPSTTQQLRLRVNFTVGTANMAVSTTYFKLQFRAGTDSDCSAGSWTDVNTSATWEYYDATGVADGADITASLGDTTSGKGQEYVESKTSGNSLNHVAVNTTEITEYDFNIVGTTATTAERYLFRVVETDSGGTGTTAFTAYTNCAILNTEPGTANLMRHGNVYSGGIEAGFFWAD